MPLSDHEQRILEEIEKSLYEEDPRLAQKARWGSPRLQLKLGLIAFLAGFAVLIGFFILSSVIVGVAAFGAMVGGIVLIANGLRLAALDGDGEGVAGLFKRLDEGIRGRRRPD